MSVVFPPIESASEEGLLAIGGDLSQETLLSAYSQGIFPWPISKETPLTWFSPDPRGVLHLENFHLPKSFKKFLKKTNMIVKYNTNFEKVLLACAHTPRKNEQGTWITSEMLRGYNHFFNQGNAYSVEVYLDDKLVGGLYGVCIGGYVSGESMFHTETNASKVSLHALVTSLKHVGISWIDTQMVTPILASMGAQEITRKLFIEKLNQVINKKLGKEKIFATEFSELNQSE